MPLPRLGSTRELVIGPDNVWVSRQLEDRVLRVSTTGRVVGTTDFPEDSGPHGIDVDRRSHVWVTEEAGAAYAELDPVTGLITEHRTDVEGAKLAALDFDCFGNLWVRYNLPGLIDRVRPDLTVSRCTLPTTAPVGHRIISGPDGSMWFTELAADTVGSITTGCPTPRRLSRADSVSPDL